MIEHVILGLSLAVNLFFVLSLLLGSFLLNAGLRPGDVPIPEKPSKSDCGKITEK